MYSDYYLIGGVITYLIFIGYCSYHYSTYEGECKWPSCLQCIGKDDDEYSLINV